MAGRVKFYRGAAGSSLPKTQEDGAIFIIERQGTNNLGDMYVDMDNGKRLHIIPDLPINIYNSSMAGTESQAGQIYLFTTEGDPCIAVGDGKAYINDLPRYNAAVKAAIQTALTQKVNAYLGTEYLSLENNKKNSDTGAISGSHLSDGLVDQENQALNSASETLVLSRELWLSF